MSFYVQIEVKRINGAVSSENFYEFQNLGAIGLKILYNNNGILYCTNMMKG